ncbi:MAG: hypothetical protein ACHQ4F_03010 [Candidatus Dormibacteria bacterium]
MMRENEYVVVAPGTEHVLERVSGELIKRHTYVEALWVAEQGDQAVCRLVTDDRDGAIAAITAAGFKVSSVREVLVDRFPDAPGSLAAISRRAANAGLNLASVYPGAHGDLVLACDDLNALEAAVVERPTGGGI